MKIFFFCLAALVIAGGTAWLRTRSRTHMMRVLQQREALDDNLIYSRFYLASGIEKASVQELWHEVANTLKIPAELLRPTDRFGKEIGVSLITSEELDYLGELALKRAKADGRSIDLKSIRSVDDYVRALGHTHS